MLLLTRDRSIQEGASDAVAELRKSLFERFFNA
jgi:hypothetical protein